MTTYYYKLFYGSVTDPSNGKIDENPDSIKIDSIHLLDSIQNIQYKYVDLIKSIDPDIKTRDYYNRPIKTLYMHYKPGCPYTRRAIETIMQYPDELIIRLWNINTNGNAEKVKEYLRSYKKQYNLKDFNTETMPQFFYKGQPLGGADTLAYRLQNLN